MPYLLFLKKNSEIFNCRLLQITGGALRVNTAIFFQKYGIISSVAFQWMMFGSMKLTVQGLAMKQKDFMENLLISALAF